MCTGGSLWYYSDGDGCMDHRHDDVPAAKDVVEEAAEEAEEATDEVTPDLPLRTKHQAIPGLVTRSDHCYNVHCQ